MDTIYNHLGMFGYIHSIPSPLLPLGNPKPNPLHPIPRHPLGPKPIRRIQRRLPRQNIRLLRLHKLRPLPNLPKHKKHCINQDPHIRRRKAVKIKSLRRTRERPKAVKQENNSEEDEGGPGEVGLEGGAEGEGGAGDGLGAEGGVEADIGYGDGHPGEEDAGGGEVLEPLEDGLGAGAAGHVCEEGEGGRDADAVVGYPAVVWCY